MKKNRVARIFKLFISECKIFSYRIIKKIKNKLNLTKALNIFLKLVYILLFVILIVNIAQFSYQAFLYPIRTGLYFDECSYIAMGKYFRTIPPIDIARDHFLKNKPLPNIYNEFNCRLLTFPLILSYPLKYTEDIIKLHQFKTIILVMGAIVFFILGFKLSGLAGGVLASCFWIGTPLINYWGHFFMTECPSFVFLILGFIFLLYSDKNGISSILGGMSLGLSFLTRFTTSLLMLPAPFILIAILFNPFKRKNFQILGELSKLFAGFVIAVIPYFAFMWFLYNDPLTAFKSARFAVDNFLVSDTLYYAKNLWLEAGDIVKFYVTIGFFSPIIFGGASLFRVLSKDLLKYKPVLNTFNLNFKFSKQKLFKLLKFIIKYHGVFISSLIYYSIIILSLVLSVSVYLTELSNIPHKLPRYLMGALIPLLIIASMGFGVIELFIINFFRFLGNLFLKYNKEIIKPVWIKYLFISICFSLFAFITSFYAYKTAFIWDKILSRNFYNDYKVSKEALDELKSKGDDISIKRLQPEYNNWKMSIKERLFYYRLNPKLKIDNTDYYGEYSRNILKYINNIIKADEVFYVDIFNQTPYTPAYTEMPCIYIDNAYNYSIDQLINSGQISYKGYFIISNNINDDIIEQNNEAYIRSLNKYAVEASKKFQFITDFGKHSLYYYSNGKPFDYKFGTISRIKRLYEGQLSDNVKNINKDKAIKKIINKFLQSWKLLFQE
jgi:hypothetical protein